MPFCSNCGTSVTEAMSFCPGCGTALAAAQTPPTATLPAGDSYTYTDTNTQYTGGDYKLILISRGTCSVANAVHILQNILGYASAQARELVHAAPVECACNLSLPQAQYLAQTLTEYGLAVSVLNGMGEYVDLSATANTSVFDSNGNLLPAIAAALAMLSVTNRVRHVSHWRHLGPPPPLFRLNYRRMPPPPRHSHRAPPPPPRRHSPPPMGRPSRPTAPLGGRPSGGPGRGPGGPGRGPSMGRGPGGGRGPSGGGRGGRGGGGGGGRR